MIILNASQMDECDVTARFMVKHACNVDFCIMLIFVSTHAIHITLTKTIAYVIVIKMSLEFDKQPGKLFLISP